MQETSSIPGSVRSSGEGNGNLLQYSCLEDSKDRGAWHSPWGRKESDMTEQLTLSLSSFCGRSTIEIRLVDRYKLYREMDGWIEFDGYFPEETVVCGQSISRLVPRVHGVAKSQI